MSSSSNDIHEPELRPLLSPGFVYRVMAAVAVLAALTAAISFAGRWFGENLALAGHTASNEVFDIFIGQDHLRLPANMIRFEAQRATSIVERVDLYLTWPGLEGYSDQSRALFNNIDAPKSLIFLQISQSTMSRDMSGRLGPIYSQVFDGAPAALTDSIARELYDLEANEVMGTAPAQVPAASQVPALGAVAAA